MADETATAPGGWASRRGGSGAQRATTLGLVLAWSHAEPGRVGQWAPIPAGRSVLGRGDGEEGETRVVFAPSRPGAPSKGAPLRSGGLSRRQLELARSGASLEVASVGRAGMRVNRRAASRSPVQVGDVVTVDGEIVLLVAEREALMLGGGAAPTFGFGEPDEDGILGESAATFRLRDAIAFVASRDEHVLVSGPSGAGKELCARAIHRRSKRAAGPFVGRNAATLPVGLIDAELFGNAKNFPNPGMRERRGLVGEAHEGTLFLDEIGELPTELQAHLLRLLDDGEYHRLGEDRSRHSNLRLLTAMNRSVDALKHDLVARLKLRLDVPGLDERREDIPLLVRHLLRKLADGALRGRFFDPASGEARVSPELVSDLLVHTYTTHVRELETILLTALGDSREDFIDTSPRVEALIKRPPSPTELTDETIREVLAREGGNASAAWRALGMSSRDALLRLMKKRGIKPRP